MGQEEEEFNALDAYDDEDGGGEGEGEGEGEAEGEEGEGEEGEVKFCPSIWGFACCWMEWSGACVLQDGVTSSIPRWTALADAARPS